MKITQLTHHDLDGYGASTVVGLFAQVARVEHVARYADVGPAVEAELGRLRRTDEREMLIITDLGLEPVAVTFIKNFVALNAKRGPERAHKLLVLDHHASSLDQLAAQGLAVSPSSASDAGAAKQVTLDDPAVTVIIDETRCATRLAYDYRALYATLTPSPETISSVAALVAAVDVVDLWRKDNPLFRQALVLDEAFWDHVSGFIPTAHPWHEGFIAQLLLGMAERLGRGSTAAEIEREVGSIRTQVLDALLADDPGDDRDLTARMRIAPVLARSPTLFRRLDNGAKLSFGLDAGTFQRVSDAIMASGDAALVINLQRSGSMSFRSNNETALDTARQFQGGGHKDAAGGRLPVSGVTSLADAVAQVEAVLNPPKPDLSASPFAALQALKLQKS